jgi:hypothetical protein
VEKSLKWYDMIFINIFWLGLNITTNILPVLLPALVLMFMPENQKALPWQISGSWGWW